MSVSKSIDIIVTNSNRYWPKKNSEAIVVDPHIYLNNKSELKSQYKRVQVLAYDTNNITKRIVSAEYVESITERVIEKIIDAQNLGFIDKRVDINYYYFHISKQVSFIFSLIRKLEHLDPNLSYTLPIIGKSSYLIPHEDNNFFFMKNSDYGLLQVFSILWSHHLKHILKIDKHIVQVKDSRFSKKDDTYRSVDIKRIIKRVIIKRLFSDSKVTTLLYGSYISNYNYLKLWMRSSGRIKREEVLIHSKSTFSMPDIDQRNKIFDISGRKTDLIERLTLEVLKYFIPTIFIENIPKSVKSLEGILYQYPSLANIVNENYIGNDQYAMTLSLCSHYGLKHIGMHHNGMVFFSYGNHVKKAISIPASYIGPKTIQQTLVGSSNFIVGGSLYNYSVSKSIVNFKKYNILFVRTIPLASIDVYNTHSIDGASNILHYLKSSKLLFKHINPEIMNQSCIKYYPKGKAKNRLLYDDSSYYAKYFRVKNVTDQTNKKLIPLSRLVVVDNFSTSQIESILANIPTIILIYPLYHSYYGIFDKLLKDMIINNIVFDDPYKASLFINRRFIDINNWWYSSKVQVARKRYLNFILGCPSESLKYLAKISS
jgi:putative transferase (TIGR04331 family)